MGKGEIIGGGEKGLYDLILLEKRDAIDAAIARINESIELLLHQIVIEYQTEPRFRDWEKISLLRAQIAGLEKRRERLENIPDEEEVSAWAVDLTKDLSGEVGTIEIPDAPGESVLIRPGFEGGAVYEPERDGEVSPIMNLGPVSAYFYRALMPAVQRYRPGYRFGVIESIDGDECDLRLEVAKDEQGNSINQTETLQQVPIEYMTCNGSVFNNGDSVVVEFQERKWESPKVIGFKSDPKACFPWLVIRIAFDAFGTNISFVWDIEKNEFATNIPNGSDGFVSMPCQYDELNYWLNRTTNPEISRNWRISTMDPATDLWFPDREDNAGSQYFEHIDVCGGNDIVSYILRNWNHVVAEPITSPWDFPDEPYRSRTHELNETFDEDSKHYLATFSNNNGVCYRSKLDEILDFKAHLSEKMTRKKNMIMQHRHLQQLYSGPDGGGERWYNIGNKLNVIYQEHRRMELESPIGTVQIYDISEPNSIDYEDDGTTVIRGDLNNTLSEVNVDFFEGRPVHTEKIFVQLYIAQATVKTWRNTPVSGILRDAFDIDYKIKNLALFGSPVVEEETFVGVISSIAITENGIIEGRYDPNTGVRNDKLSAAIKHIVADSEKIINSITVMFRI